MTPPAPTLTLSLRNFSPDPADRFERLVATARAADDAGVDRLVVVDHVVLGEHLDAYDGGSFPTGPEGAWLEPMTVLSVVAGATTRIRLGTGILIAALRRPVVLAKAAATLDVLSGGRLDLGVGVGWQREEYEAAGLRFEDRGRLLDETLAVCQRLWQPSPTAVADADAVWCEPKPVQAGGVPIWISGRLHQRTIDRVVRHGAWIPWGDHRTDPAPAIAVLRQAMADHGRDPDLLQVRGSLTITRSPSGEPAVVEAMASVPASVEAGVTDFQFAIAMPDDLDRAGELLRSIVSEFRAATATGA